MQIVGFPMRRLNCINSCTFYSNFLSQITLNMLYQNQPVKACRRTPKSSSSANKNHIQLDLFLFDDILILYFHIDHLYIYKKIISNFLCSSIISLMIEKGRHQNFDHSLRFCLSCLKCKAHIIKDKFHLFLVYLSILHRN